MRVKFQNLRDSLYLHIGGGELNSCARYGQVRLSSELGDGYEEYELDNDLEAITYILTEIKKRSAEFQKGRAANKMDYIKGKKKFAEKYFSGPLKLRNL